MSADRSIKSAKLSNPGAGTVDSATRHKGEADILDQTTPGTVNRAALRSANRKLDLFLLPVITAIYWLNFLDRSSIGNARPAGLQSDLGLSNTQYSIALTVTYVPYIVAELPLTLAMKYIGPHIMIPALVTSWGLVCLFQGFVTSYSGLLAARFFLGLTEGAILPSSVAYLSTFYIRPRLGRRIALYFSATSLAGAFSGLLAAALIQMDGLGGKRGWAWIFIIEGILTVLFGIFSFFVLPRDPESARYLTLEEKEAIMAAHDEDRQLQGTKDQEVFSWSGVASAFKAPQMWLMFAQFFCSGVMLYALAFFAPTIVQSVGYRGTSIQLYTVPPYACSTFVAIAACWTSDYFRHRGSFVILASLIALVGYAIFYASVNPNARYGGLFLMVIGSYTVAPLQSVWMPNNLDPYTKRVTGIAMGFVATNSGGILSTWMFPTTDGPRFFRGTGILLGLSSALVVFAILNSVYLLNANRKKEQALQARGRQSPAQGHRWVDGAGDRAIGFKYIT